MQTMWAATMRAMAQALLGFMATALITYSQLPEIMTKGDRWEKALIAGGIAACAALGFRGAIEGGYDSYRASKNLQGPADVGFDKLAEKP